MNYQPPPCNHGSISDLEAKRLDHMTGSAMAP
jgi:hypothetical protein